MAVRTPVVSNVLQDAGAVISVLYTGLLNGDSGSVIDSANWGNHSDRSIEVFGTFGAGGTLVWEGCNDGATFQTLDDPSSTPLSFTAAKTKEVLEISQQQRPRVTGGDGTTNLTVAVIMRRPAPARA